MLSGQLIACTASLLFLQGCDPGPTDKPVSQAAARVNGIEIAAHRIDNAQAMRGDEVHTPSDRRDILDSLIYQELAAQAAEMNGLDRSATVKKAIETAGREVLARAWADRLASTLPRAGTKQVSRYYADHPELFSRRRVYEMEQIIVPEPDSAVLAQLQQKIGAGDSLRQIASWLQAMRIGYSFSAGKRAAEQLPIDIVSDLAGQSNGSIRMFRQPDVILIVHMLSSVTQPVSATTAAPRIASFLTQKEWRRQITTEIDQLRDSASITYLGEFATDGSNRQAGMTKPSDRLTFTTATRSTP